MISTTTLRYYILLIFIFGFNISCTKQTKNSISHSSQSHMATTPISRTHSYDELHRPQIHFSPVEKWMNDPNGMVYYDGEFHLFYQYYPEGVVWGPMHWGHAVSRDLISWQHLPIALYPDKHGYIFSGSAVIDWDNTSGFGTKDKPAMVAIFTYHDPEGEKANAIDFQTQGIAYSLDKGRTWTVYEKNPMLPNPGIRDFRDPKVLWHAPTSRWVMILATGDYVQLYGSPNLIEWTHMSDFGQGQGSHGGVWECPDLFELPVEGTDEKRWVMIVSIGDGATNKGSGTQYFVGTFDGTTFTNENPPETELWLDYGTDNYAGVTWSDVPADDGRRLFIGWMSNWQYAQEVPTSPWRSAMTLPRTLSLSQTKEGVRMRSEIVEELTIYSKERKDYTYESVTNKPLTLHSETQSTREPYRLQIDLGLYSDSADAPPSLIIELSNTRVESLSLEYSVEEKMFTLDRSQVGTHSFSEKYKNMLVQKAPRTAAPTADTDRLTLDIIMDVSSIEVMADGGLTALTSLFFPTEPLTICTLRAKGGYTGECKVSVSHLRPMDVL